MKRKVYNKLVRNNIPDIIDTKGDTCFIESLSDIQYIEMLDKKLNEELAEYQSNKSLAELADLLEVIYSIAKARGWSIEQLEAARQEKANQSGSFDRKIFLKEVIEN